MSFTSVTFASANIILNSIDYRQSDGTMFIAGQALGGLSYLYHYASNGTQLSMQSLMPSGYSSFAMMALKVDQMTGEIVATGSAIAISDSRYVVVVYRFNADKSVAMQASLPSQSGDALPNGLAIDESSRRLYVSGKIDGNYAGYSHKGAWDTFLAAMTYNGGQLWIVQEGATLDDDLTCIELFGNNVIVGGYWNDATFFGLPQGFGYLASYTTAGVKNWATNFVFQSAIYSITIRDNLIQASGVYNSSGSNYELFWRTFNPATGALVTSVYSAGDTGKNLQYMKGIIDPVNEMKVLVGTGTDDFIMTICGSVVSSRSPLAIGAVNGIAQDLNSRRFWVVGVSGFNGVLLQESAVTLLAQGCGTTTTASTTTLSTTTTSTTTTTTTTTSTTTATIVTTTSTTTATIVTTTMTSTPSTTTTISSTTTTNATTTTSTSTTTLSTTSNNATSTPTTTTMTTITSITPTTAVTTFMTMITTPTATTISTYSTIISTTNSTSSTEVSTTSTFISIANSSAQSTTTSASLALAFNSSMVINGNFSSTALSHTSAFVPSSFSHSPQLSSLSSIAPFSFDYNYNDDGANFQSTQTDGNNSDVGGQPLNSGNSSVLSNVIAGVSGIVAFVVLSVLVVLYLQRRKRAVAKAKRQNSPTYGAIAGTTQMSTAQTSTVIPSSTYFSQTMAPVTDVLAIPAFLVLKAGYDFRPLTLLAQTGNGSLYTGDLLNNNARQKFGVSTVVIKIVSESVLSMGDRSRNSFYQELTLMYLFRDQPQFIKLVGYSEQPAAIVMKHYQPGSLKDFISGEQRAQGMVYSKYQLLFILKQLTMGYRHMHSMNIVHFDIKPDNVLLEICAPNLLMPIICDFGITQIFDSDAYKVKALQVSNVRGLSFTYAAPELLIEFRRQFCNGLQREAGKSMDVYAFAVMMFECLTRERACQSY